MSTIPMDKHRKNASRSAEPGRVLVVDDHHTARESMGETLRQAGYHVACSPSALAALKLLDQESFDVIITDLKMPGMNGLEFIRVLQDRKTDAQILMVTAHATVSSAVEAMRHGAFDYIEKPFDADQLEQLVGRALRHGAVVERRSSIPAALGTSEVVMVGNSQLMQALRRRIALAAPTNETVLISGESGTGKELVARSLHAASGRSHQALVGLNCPALSPQLMESELFGHEKGAFTSADAPRVGRFELADGGTILFDEVTEIDLSLQAKLLRVLQERSFERVGSSQTRRCDVRVLATTNRDLRTEVRSGRFREDLFFRLNVLPIEVPALRQRPEDIPLLVEHFLSAAAERLGRAPCYLDGSARELLLEYHWPGNVREMENIITRASVLAAHERISGDGLRPWLIDSTSSPALRIVTEEAGVSAPSLAVGTKLHEMERQLIESTLAHFDGHRGRTAAALGIGQRTLTNKLREYGYAPRAKTTSRAA